MPHCHTTTPRPPPPGAGSLCPTAQHPAAASESRSRAPRPRGRRTSRRRGPRDSHSPARRLISPPTITTLSMPQEIHEIFELFAWLELVLDAFQCLRQIEIRAVENLVRLAQDSSDGRRDAVPPQTDRVQVQNPRRAAVAEHEGRDVDVDLAAAADHRHLPDAAELVYTHHPAEDRVVLHVNMAAQSDIARERVVVPDDTVMTHVGIGH